MKDQADTVTFELPLPRRRGRPSTGEALTPAQRKRAQRERDRAASRSDDLGTCTTERLLRDLGHAVAHAMPFTVQAIATELQYRAETAYAAKLDKARQDREAVTVTENSLVHLPMLDSVTVTENSLDDLDYGEDSAFPAPAKRAKPAPVKRVKPAPVKRAKPAPKYRHAATGETWSGRGMAPKWVQVYVARGGLLADLLL